MIPKKPNGINYLRKLFQQIVDSKTGSFLAILKIFGKCDEPYLAFASEGYSLALDFQNLVETENLFKKLGIEENDFVVSLSPVSRQPYKVWPADRFAHIADWLTVKYNAKILFLFGPGEKHFVESVRNLMKMPALSDYSVPNLSETLSILKKVNLHLGNDNGIRHVAVAADTPSLAIFGRPWAANWTPPEPTPHHALEYDPGCKKKCVYPKCKLECLKGVNVEAVKTELEILINNLN